MNDQGNQDGTLGLPDEWTLEDVMEAMPRPRTAITKKHFKKGETRMMSFRIPWEDYRKMQIVVDQRRIPGIETFSDIMTDAIFIWLEKFYEDHPTIDPSAAQELKMIRLQSEREDRNAFLFKAERILTDLIDDRHIRGIDEFHTATIEARFAYVRQDAPTDFLNKLDRLVDRARRLLDDGQ